MVKELKARGFSRKWTATYLRLHPKRSSSKQGRTHSETVPVKLIKPQNNFYEKHLDVDFWFSLVDDVNILAPVLGPEECMFLSLDDKAYVKLGIVAAKP